MKKHEKYLEHVDLKDATHLEVSVTYTKGGMNYFGGSTIPRGYYLCVRPVKKRGGMISYNLFAGKKQLLIEASRYSEKQFWRAVKMAEAFEDELMAEVLAESKAA